ncbi:MAG: signal recognition particle-docking protein FtsY [DPANN group archaeon]|nr:signal recognition particle-docking protein FtsY [DPANN group archaeon]
MFDFLKKAFKSFTDKIGKPEEKGEIPKEEKPKVKAPPAEEPERLPEAEEEIPEPVSTEEILKEEEIIVEKPKELKKLEEKEEKRGFLKKLAAIVTEAKVSDEQFHKLFTVLEIELIQNNVAFTIIQQIRENLEDEIVGKSFNRQKLTDTIKKILRQTIVDTLEMPKPLDLLELAKEKKSKNEPLILMFIGTNGHGKTTTLAKLAHLFQKNDFRCIFAASDTFRAASIEQLEYHGNKLGIRVIKHNYGSDPAAVAFDAVKAKDKDIVMIDTAGRQSPNTNLMEELAKIKKVAKPDLTIYVGEAIAGSDLVEQAKNFNEKIGIDAIILTKADVDDKGGAILSVTQVTNKPILYLGVGQEYKDLEKFEPEKFVSKIIG